MQLVSCIYTLSSRVTGACPVTTDLIMRVNLTTTMTEIHQYRYPKHPVTITPQIVTETLTLIRCRVPA